MTLQGRLNKGLLAVLHDIINAMYTFVKFFVNKCHMAHSFILTSLDWVLAVLIPSNIREIIPGETWQNGWVMAGNTMENSLLVDYNRITRVGREAALGKVAKGVGRKIL